MAAAKRRLIEDKIAAGEHYDAQQMAKTVHRRLVAKGQQAEAADFCVDSACRFAGAGEYELALDLGKDLVDSMEASKAPPDSGNLERVEAVLTKIPPQAAVVPKYALLNRALKWSAGTASMGHARLHRLAANSYLAEQEYGKCQSHLVFCGDGPALADMVREWRKEGYPNERDLFPLRTLLILLSLNDLMTSRTYWDAVCGVSLGGGPKLADDTADGEPIPEPPVQCGTFLLAAAEAGSLSFFRTVRAKYALVIRRDFTFDKYLDQVELAVFGARQTRGGLGALFDVLLGGGAGGS